MKTRLVSFYIDPDFEEQVLKVIDEVVIARYRSLPHFIGFMLAEEMSRLQSDDRRRREILGVSVWDDDLEDSDRMVDEFREHLRSIAGETTMQKDYGVVRFVRNPLPSTAGSES